jgi:hypothetical protein
MWIKPYHDPEALNYSRNALVKYWGCVSNDHLLRVIARLTNILAKEVPLQYTVWGFNLEPVGGTNAPPLM